MVPPNERDPAAFSWHSAAMLASAIVVLGLIMAWPTQQAEAVAPAGARAAAERCSQGDAVSNFVCRNSWVAQLQRNYR